MAPVLNKPTVSVDVKQHFVRAKFWGWGRSFLDVNAPATTQGHLRSNHTLIRGLPLY